MSVCYWGDKFYGINRIKHPELFDKQKERKVILESLYSQWDEEFYLEAKEIEDISFENLDELEIENGAEEVTDFLSNTGIHPYHDTACNESIIFFGIHHSLPWQIEKIETQEEIDRKIYNALKPILKNNIEFENIEPFINEIIINGQDDYITYTERGK